MYIHIHIYIYIHVCIYGWLSKLWSLFWVLVKIRHLFLGYPKRDPNFDNYPYIYIYIYLCIYLFTYLCIYVFMYLFVYGHKVWVRASGVQGLGFRLSGLGCWYVCRKA